MMMVRKESGRWLLRTAECEAEHRECCVWAEQNTSRITQLSCSPACTLQHSQSTLVTAPLPACCRSERGKRGGSSDDCLHLAAQEIWDLQAAKKRGCSPRSEIIYSSSGTNLKIYIDFMCSANKLLRKSYHIGLGCMLISCTAPSSTVSGPSVPTDVYSSSSPPPVSLSVLNNFYMDVVCMLIFKIFANISGQMSREETCL